MKVTLIRKDVEINEIKQQQPNSSDGKKQEEEIYKLKQRLEETRDLCVEYNHKIENIKKESKEQVDKLNIEKTKFEEELRSTVLEKNLLRDSERILLHTFDTLKMHYNAKKNSTDTASAHRKENVDKNNESSSKEEQVKCNFR